MVDPRRLELLTSSMPWKRSSQLNYGPMDKSLIFQISVADFGRLPISGGCRGIRTPDQLVKSQLLYRLSYAPRIIRFAQFRGKPLC